MVAFSPDGTLLASGGDKTVRLWDVANGQLVGAPLTGFSPGTESVAFTRDGKTLITGRGDGMVRLWNIDVGSWPARACAMANRNLTQQEWRQYVGSLPYQKTCPGLPAGS